MNNKRILNYFAATGLGLELMFLPNNNVILQILCVVFFGLNISIVLDDLGFLQSHKDTLDVY